MSQVLVFLQILGFVNRVQDEEATVDLDRFTMAEVESNAVRCPDSEAAERMYKGEVDISICVISTTYVPQIFSASFDICKK